MGFPGRFCALALSDDLTRRKNLSLRNTLIGEGDAREPASSFPVSVAILGKPESFDRQRAVSVVVTCKTKQSVVMQRQFSGLAFGRSGHVVKALLVEDRTCASIEITARGGDSVRGIAVPVREMIALQKAADRAMLPR